MKQLLLGFLAVALAILSQASIGAQSSTEQLLKKLSQLERSAVQAMQANDRNGAIEIAGEIIAACNPLGTSAENPSAEVDTVGEPPLPLGEPLDADDPRRIHFLLFAARLDFGVGNTGRALSTLQTISADAKPDSAGQIEADAFLLMAKIDSGQDYIDDAIDVLARSSRLSSDHATLRYNCQDRVIDAIIGTYSASNINHEQLTSRLQKIETAMVDKGVPVGVARLTRFAEATYLTRHHLGEQLEQLLAELKNVVVSEQVSTSRRAYFWNLYALLQIDRRHYADAFDACGEFERLCKQLSVDGSETYQSVIARDQSAYVALMIGDYEAAKQALERSRQTHTQPLRIHSEQERRIRLENATNWRVNLAKAMEGTNEFGNARTLLQQAEKSLTKKDRQSRPDLAALVDNNLGLNHYLTGELETASELMTRAKDTIDNIGGFDERIGEASVNAGWIALGHDDRAKAAKYFSEAAAFFSDHLSREHPRFAETLTYLARVTLLQGDIEKARQWIVQAEDLDFQRICRDLTSSDSARDRIAMVQEARVHPESVAWPGTIDTYLELAPQLAITPAQQYDVVLRWKGLIQRFDSNHATQDAASMKLERDVESKLQEAYFRKVSFLNKRTVLQEIDQYETQLRQIQRARRSDRQISAEALVTSSKEIAANLQPDDLFVDIFQIRTFRRPNRTAMVGSNREYLAFAVQPDGRVHRLSFGTAEALDVAIETWTNVIIEQNQAMTSSELTDHHRRLDIAAGAVAEMVQKPLLDLGVPIDRLIVRADGITHLIPWAAFPGTNGKRYWIENVRIHVANSAGGAKSRAVQSAPPSLLAVGGVDFGGLTQYPPLSGSLTEKRDVAEQFRSRFGSHHVQELEAAAANEAALIGAMPGKRFIHLATHGFYHRRGESNVFGVTGATTLLQTGLIVAPPDDADPRYDQYLTAAEISELDLSAAALVVLSACESGLGQPLAGQGVQGMLGSFHAAGAERVVGTLWKVNDEATVSMMNRFYDHLWNEQRSPADALRAAQLDMIRTAPGRPDADLLSHPYAWAAFICSAK